MSKFRHKLNLQLFAGETSVEVDDQKFEIDPSELDDKDDDDLEVEEDEREDFDKDDNQDEADDREDEPEQKLEDAKEEPAQVKPRSKEPDATAKAVMAERQRWKQKLDEANRKASLADRMMKQAGVSDINVLQAQLDELEAARHIENGVDPQYAQFLVQQQRQINEMQQTLKKQKYDNEASTLKQEPFFADIDEHRDELEDFADRMGMTLEEAYMSKRGKERMKEYEREIELRNKTNKEKKDRTKVDMTATGEKVKAPKVNLSPDAMAIAKQAVKMGHFKSVEEYAKYMK